MSFRLSANSRVERVLLVSLSNIGDIVLTFPVFDALHETFPRAEITVVVGPKGESLLSGNPYVRRTVVFDKGMPWAARLRWVTGLRRQNFDLVVDLRNSMLPFILRTRYATRPAFLPARCHMKDKHLRRLVSVVDGLVVPREKYAGTLSSVDLKSAEKFVGGAMGYVLIAPGAADARKRWHEEGFRKVVRYLLEARGCKVVVAGDKNDQPVAGRILDDLSGDIVNLCGRTTLPELAGVVRRAGLALTNDSGIMHLVSYFDIPTVALFGPTDPAFYGPWGADKEALRKGESMMDIAAEDVIKALDAQLEG